MLIDFRNIDTLARSKENGGGVRFNVRDAVVARGNDVKGVLLSRDLMWVGNMRHHGDEEKRLSRDGRYFCGSFSFFVLLLSLALLESAPIPYLNARCGRRTNVVVRIPSWEDVNKNRL